MSCVYCLILSTLSGLSFCLDCGDPSKPDHSMYTFTGSSTPGTEVQYSCLDGYKLIGETTQHCHESGTWLPVQPMCVPASEVTCGFPGHGPHVKVDLVGHTFLLGSIATYSCDVAYVLVGTSQRSCQENGKWSSNAPFCAAKVSQQTTVTEVSQFVDVNEKLSRKGSAILDNDNMKCSIAEQTDQLASSWKVDLLEPQPVDVIDLIFGDQTDVAVSLRVSNDNSSNETTLMLNTFSISKWSGRVRAQGGDKFLTSYEYSLKQSVEFQYLTIEAMPTPNHSTLELCELIVLSKSASSVGQCVFDHPGSDTGTALHNNICYHFAQSLALPWTAADQKCKELTKGGLATNVDVNVQKVFSNSLDKVKQPIKSNFWIGGVTMTAKGTKNVQWLWKNGNPLEEFYWGKLQPDMSATKPACLSLSGELGWQWDAEACTSKFYFICQHKILQCGTPEVPEDTIIDDYARLNTDIGATLIYSCPRGYTLQGDKERHCLETGLWSSYTPFCLPDESNDDCEIIIKYPT